MNKDFNISDQDKINLIRKIQNKALVDMEIIKKERDRKIKELMKEIDARHIEKALKAINN
jgi:hypothetical protein